MLLDVEHEKQIIEKTVCKVCEGINTGTWRFSLKYSDNEGDDFNTTYTREGKAICQEYEVSLRFESQSSWEYDENLTSYKWFFLSNLKQSNREDPFVFNGGLGGVQIAYSRHRPAEKEILELVRDSIELLEEAQIAFDLQDIDNATK